MLIYNRGKFAYLAFFLHDFVKETLTGHVENMKTLFQSITWAVDWTTAHKPQIICAYNARICSFAPLVISGLEAFIKIK